MGRTSKGMSSPLLLEKLLLAKKSFAIDLHS